MKVLVGVPGATRGQFEQRKCSLDSTAHHHRLKISHAFFELLSECIRIRSNEVERFVVIDEVVSVALESARDLIEVHANSWRDHLSAQPPQGTIDLALTLNGAVHDRFIEFSNEAAVELNRTLEKYEVLSVLLFSYLVNCHATGLLAVMKKKTGVPVSGDQPNGTNLYGLNR